MKNILRFSGMLATLAGLFAYLAPLAFHELLAEYTGAPNAHLVRDVGAAYIAAGVALWWAALAPAWRAPLVTVAAVFLLLHAGGHLIDLFSGHVQWSHLLIDSIQVFLPAMFVCGLALYFLKNTDDGNP